MWWVERREEKGREKRRGAQTESGDPAGGWRWCTSVQDGRSGKAVFVSCLCCAFPVCGHLPRSFLFVSSLAERSFLFLVVCEGGRSPVFPFLTVKVALVGDQTWQVRDTKKREGKTVEAILNCPIDGGLAISAPRISGPAQALSFFSLFISHLSLCFSYSFSLDQTCFQWYPCCRCAFWVRRSSRQHTMDQELQERQRQRGNQETVKDDHKKTQKQNRTCNGPRPGLRRDGRVNENRGWCRRREESDNCPKRQDLKIPLPTYTTTLTTTS